MDKIENWKGHLQSNHESRIRCSGLILFFSKTGGQPFDHHLVCYQTSSQSLICYQLSNAFVDDLKIPLICTVFIVAVKCSLNRLLLHMGISWKSSWLVCMYTVWTTFFLQLNVHLTVAPVSVPVFVVEGVFGSFLEEAPTGVGAAASWFPPTRRVTPRVLRPVSVGCSGFIFMICICQWTSWQISKITVGFPKYNLS